MSRAFLVLVSALILAACQTTSRSSSGADIVDDPAWRSATIGSGEKVLMCQSSSCGRSAVVSYSRQRGSRAQEMKVMLDRASSYAELKPRADGKPTIVSGTKNGNFTAFHCGRRISDFDGATRVAACHGLVDKAGRIYRLTSVYSDGDRALANYLRIEAHVLAADAL